MMQNMQYQMNQMILLKVYRYDLNNAGIRSDPFIGKDIVMNGDTQIYYGNLYLTGDIHKG